MRFSIDEYAKTFKVSKEMIHNKLRTRRLNYIIESGVTYIIVPRHLLDDTQKIAIETQSQTKAPPPIAQNSNKTNVGMIISLYQKENHHLKLKIKELEAKIDTLIETKEQMLIAERTRIEAIYIAKDEQLKGILEVLSNKLMLSHTDTIHDVDTIAASIPDTPIPSTGLIELKRYLKFIGVPSAQRKIIRNRFEQRYGSDTRIIQKEGIFYLDLSKYDYTDLL